jgi:hypothetical protein
MRRKSVKGLTLQDFREAARALGCRPEQLKAFYIVESSGEGFDASGRLKILYEPHVVHRNTKGTLTGRLFDWQWNGEKIQIPLSYRRWRRLTRDIRIDPNEWHPYKESEQGQWEMLATAYQYAEGALAGASYGGFQILGENATSLGYRDTFHMIEELYEGEEAHLEAAIRYLKRNNLLTALARSDWEAIAKGYNGGDNYVQYAEKMMTAEKRAKGAFV